MRHGCHGSQGARARLALGAVVTLLAAACGGGGGGGGGVGANAFSAQLLPVELVNGGAGYGNVAFAGNGDVLLVGGDTDSLWRISRTDGSVTEVASDVVPGAGGSLLSVVDPGTGVLYVGDVLGDVYEVDGGSATLLESTGAGAIHGMVMAAGGFGDLQGSLIAATGAGGIVAVDPGLGGTTTIANPGPVYSDLAFDQSTLYAVDYTNGEIVEVEAGGTVTTFVPGAPFSSPDGVAVDGVKGQLLVADSSNDTLWAVNLVGASVDAIGIHRFDVGAEPSGLAFDGVRNLVMVTEGSLVVRGVGIPGYDPADFPVNVVGADTSKGGMTLDTDGDVVAVANGASANRVFRIPRDGGDPTTLASDLGSPGGELLTAVAHDAATGTTYVGTSSGDVYSVNAGGSALFASVPIGVTGLAIAPQSFPSYGGRLVASTPTSGIYQIDPAAPAPAQFAPAIVGGVLSDLVFGADGTLYVLRNDAGEILTVTAAGVYDPHASGLNDPSAIAIDEGSELFYVVDAGTSQLVSVPIGGGAVAALASLDFHGDAFPNGIVFDGLDTVLVKHGDGSATVSGVSLAP